MDTEKAHQLLQKYRMGTCTDSEKKLIEHWYHQESAKSKDLPGPENPFAEEDLIWQRILPVLSPQTKTYKFNTWKWASVAASILIIFSASMYLYHQFGKSVPLAAIAIDAKNIKAAGKGAVLTLSNGKKINLNSTANGVIASQTGITVSKGSDGQLIYSIGNLSPDLSAKSTAPHTLEFNTIETPAGSQYQVRLPDGSNVWLNASSKLTYPVTFTGNERMVTLSGEGYFEVVHNNRMPFKVKSGNQLVEDVGTHFNINAYTDEPAIHTTLLEGSIMLKHQAESKVITMLPGQQAAFNGQGFKVKPVDIEQVIAWKDGLFIFDHTDLHALMRQISRWYNIQIVYQGDVKNEEFFGEVERKYSLAEVLKVLELDGLHFKIEDSTSASGQKKLIIMP